MVELKEPNTSGWDAWANYVLKELERLNHCIEELTRTLTELRESINKYTGDLKADTKDLSQNLKVDHAKEIGRVWAEIKLLNFKSGLWGLVGGLIPAAVVAFYFIARWFLSN